MGRMGRGAHGDVFGRARHEVDGVSDLGWHAVAGELSCAALGGFPGRQILIDDFMLEIVAQFVTSECEP